jgi:hypothetical protein
MLILGGVIFFSNTLYGSQCGGAPGSPVFQVLRGFRERTKTYFAALESQGVLIAIKPDNIDTFTAQQADGMFDSFSVKPGRAEVLVARPRGTGASLDELHLGAYMAPFVNVYKGLREFADSLIPPEYGLKPVRFLVVLKPSGLSLESSFNVPDTAVMLRVILFGEAKSGTEVVDPADVKEAKGFWEGRLNPRVNVEGVFSAKATGRFYVEPDKIQPTFGGLDVVIGLGVTAHQVFGAGTLPCFTRQSPNTEEIRTIEAILFLDK